MVRILVPMMLLLAAACGQDDPESNPETTYRLDIAYDEVQNAFTGMLHNLLDKPLVDVQITVRLSDGYEMGTTDPVNVAAKQTVAVHLPVLGRPVGGWNAEVQYQVGSVVDTSS